MKKLPVIAIMLWLPLRADDRSKEMLNDVNTGRFNVSTAGSIRVENSFGEVDIDGWDRPEVEVTVNRSSERLYNAKQRAAAQLRLEGVEITTKQAGNDIVISTAYPARNGFAHPLSRRSDIEISYHIKAPRASKLVIDHNRGGVNVFDINGDIHATVINGQITLTLASGGQDAVDARSTIGEVYSDFDGREHRRQILGEEFARPNGSPAAANLYLRVRVGDIVIQKLHGPPTD
jgi:hypothetical protein